MGLNGADKLIERLRSIGAKAFLDVVPEANQAAFIKKQGKNATLYNLVRRLPRPFGCQGVVVDLSSLVIQLAHCAETGSVVAVRLSKMLNELGETYGAQRVVLCLDNSDYIPVCKQIERDRRAQSSSEGPYVNTVALSTGVEVSVEEYAFDLDLPMPASASRMRKTGLLSLRFNQFLCRLVQSEILLDHDMQVIVCGAKFETVDTAAVAAAEEAESESGETSGPPGLPPTKWINETISRFFRKNTIPVLVHLNVRRYRPLRIGEGEGKCIHWALSMFRDAPDTSSVLVRCNDSDALIALLMNVPRVLSLPPLSVVEPGCSSRRRTREVWLDFSAPTSHKRLVNVTDLWRCVNAWTLRSVPAPLHQHYPIEALVAVAIMGGCDYVQPIKGTGIAPFLNEYMEKPKTLAANSPNADSAMMFSAENPFATSMHIVEGKLHDLIWRALIAKPEVGAVLARRGVQIMDQNRAQQSRTRVSPSEVGKEYFSKLTFEKRFNELSYEIARYRTHLQGEHARIDHENIGRVQAGQKPLSKPRPPPDVPSFEGIRAFTMRVLYSLDYYRNFGIEDPLPPHHTNPVASINGRSVYGYSLDSNNKCYEASVVVSAATLDQPFIHRVTGELVSDSHRNQRRFLFGSVDRPLVVAPSSAPGRLSRKRSSDEIMDAVAEAVSKRPRSAFDEPTSWEYQYAVPDPHGTFMGRPEFYDLIRRSV